jgi:hypothetical protein
MYFNNKSSVKNNWSTWYGYAMWQNQEWAVNQVIENGEYDKMQDYTQKGGISNAIRFNRMNMVEIVYKHDPYVFEPGEMSNSPIVTALPRKDIMKVIFDLLPLKLNKTKSGKPYDDLISEVIRFKPETASEYLHEFMSRDIYISEKFIKDMIEKYGDIVFFQSCWARSDVDEFIVPLIENTKRYEQYLPQAAKDLFLF